MALETNEILDVLRERGIELTKEIGGCSRPNGIPLSKFHHAAFDALLIGIDADYRLHVFERLLSQMMVRCSKLCSD